MDTNSHLHVCSMNRKVQMRIVCSVTSAIESTVAACTDTVYSILMMMRSHDSLNNKSVATENLS
jgi:hypothetical protein